MIYMPDLYGCLNPTKGPRIFENNQRIFIPLHGNYTYYTRSKQQFDSFYAIDQAMASHGRKPEGSDRSTPEQ